MPYINIMMFKLFYHKLLIAFLTKTIYKLINYGSINSIEVFIIANINTSIICVCTVASVVYTFIIYFTALKQVSIIITTNFKSGLVDDSPDLRLKVFVENFMGKMNNGPIDFSLQVNILCLNMLTKIVFNKLKVSKSFSIKIKY